MAAVRAFLLEQEIPAEVVNLLMAGNRTATIAAYQTAWVNWAD